MNKFLSLIVSWMCWTCHAQGLQFAFMEEHLMVFNPAYTAIGPPMKFTGGYRTQYRSLSDNYVNFGFNVETRLKAKQWKKLDNHRSFMFKHNSHGVLAAGLALYNGHAGVGQLNDLRLQGQVNSFVQIGKQSLLSVGIQALWIQRSIITSQLLFPDQYTAQGYSNQLPSQEVLEQTAINFFNTGVGVAWHYNQKNFTESSQKTFGSLGIASGMLLPEPSLTGHSAIVSRSWIGTINWHFPIGSVALLPVCILQKRGSSESLFLGGSIRRYFNEVSKYTGNNKQSWMSAGLHVRMNDAMIVRLQYQHRDQYLIGLAYEYTYSTLNRGIGTGGSLELFLRYQPPKAFLFQTKIQE